MKKTVILTLMVIILSSFGLNERRPCHPAGDLYPCSHAMHIMGDLGPCTHTYFDNWGNLRYAHFNGDLYPCTHAMHSMGDIGPCQHFCW